MGNLYEYVFLLSYSYGLEIKIMKVNSKVAFSELKKNKSSGHDNISVNVGKDIFENSNNHLFIFSIYAFPKYLKIAKFSSIFTKGDNLLITKHKAMSALPFFQEF